jgi:hypothetical protein
VSVLTLLMSLLASILSRFFFVSPNILSTLERQLQNEQFLSPNIITVIKLRRMRCVVRVARMGEMRNVPVYKMLVGKIEVNTWKT